MIIHIFMLSILVDNDYIRIKDFIMEGRKYNG